MRTFLHIPHACERPTYKNNSSRACKPNVNMEKQSGDYCSIADDGTLHVQTDETVRRIQVALLGWYRAHRRALPWRKTKSPYRIFLAEMMLQQTQVERVIPKYRDFLARFPTVRQLAAAPLADVIRLWAGLGYNRRAVHLHRAAQAVVREHGGTFPMTLQALLDLPGIGAYTARAILSFVGNAPVAVVDTNVRRVLGRVYQRDLAADLVEYEGPTERQFQGLADSLIPNEQSARWNQALMDLGSSVCTSRRPDCPQCPLLTWCQTGRAGAVQDLPSLRPKGQGKIQRLSTLLSRAHHRCVAGAAARQRAAICRVGKPRARPDCRRVTGSAGVGAGAGLGARRPRNHQGRLE